MNSKPKIAIYDLTDCEGCEIQILSLGQKIAKFASSVDILNWRLIKNNAIADKYDIALIEGTVITKEDKETIKLLREKSKIVITVGACASRGGVPSLIKEKNRNELTKYVYGENYQSLAKDAKPIDHYIQVNFKLNGCPINPIELENLLAKLLNGQIANQKYYPVCLECRAQENECLLLNGQPCLGPITLGGCGAICPTNGIKCYGCWGSTKDANFTAMINALKNQGRSQKEIKQILNLFMEEEEELKNFKFIRN